MTILYLSESIIYSVNSVQLIAAIQLFSNESGSYSINRIDVLATFQILPMNILNCFIFMDISSFFFIIICCFWWY